MISQHDFARLLHDGRIRLPEMAPGQTCDAV
jgi:hypothetical protein